MMSETEGALAQLAWLELECCKRAFALGDALIEECGAPTDAGAARKIEECSEELARRGFTQYPVARLRGLWMAAHSLKGRSRSPRALRACLLGAGYTPDE